MSKVASSHTVRLVEDGRQSNWASEPRLRPGAERAEELLATLALRRGSFHTLSSDLQMLILLRLAFQKSRVLEALIPSISFACSTWGGIHKKDSLRAGDPDNRASMTVLSDFKILHAEVDDSKEVGSEEVGYIFILIDRLIKHILADPGIPSEFCTAPRKNLAAELPPIPCGDWTTVKLSRNASDGSLSFQSAEKATLQGVEGIWHPVQVDYCDLIFTKCLTESVYEMAIIYNHPLSLSFRQS